MARLIPDRAKDFCSVSDCRAEVESLSFLSNLRAVPTIHPCSTEQPQHHMSSEPVHRERLGTATFSGDWQACLGKHIQVKQKHVCQQWHGLVPHSSRISRVT